MPQEAKEQIMKLWGKLWKSNHLIKDAVVTVETEDTRTHKIFQGFEELCLIFDLGKPMWLDSSIRDFQRHKRVRFYQDSFNEEISFDYMEFLVLEE